MGIHSGVIFCDSSANAVTGCTGCRLYSDDPAKNICYAAVLCRRYAGRKGWPKKFTEPEHFPNRLRRALKWGDLRGKDRPERPWLSGLPRIIFVNDMSDGFCPTGISPEEWLTPYIDEMAASPHIWLLLTKWPKRMREYFLRRQQPAPRNFWLGTSVLDESDGHKLKTLLSREMGTLTKNLWVSYEPAMGGFPDLDKFSCPDCAGDGTQFVGEWPVRCTSCDGTGHRLKWVVAGAASGHNGPDAQSEWFADVYCKAHRYRIPYFFKQWRKKDEGRFLYGTEYSETPWRRRRCLQCGQMLTVQQDGSVDCERCGRFDGQEKK